MSATIMFTPKKSAKALGVESSGAFIVVLEKAGFTLPGVFDEKDLPIIRGMAAAGGEDFERLSDAIEKYGEVFVEAIY